MKKQLLFILCAAMVVFCTSCEPKTEVSARIDFTLESDCGSQANLTKIENLLKSKGLPVGGNIQISAEGETEQALEIRVKQIVADFLNKVTDADINALNTGASYVYYRAAFVGFSSPIAIARKEGLK